MTAPRLSLLARSAAALRKVISPSDAKKTPPSGAGTQPVYPTTPFGTWTYEEAAAAVEAAVTNSELDAERALREGAVPIPDQAVYEDPRLRVSRLVTNRAFFEGDHWQNGAGWIGPHPAQGETDYVPAMNELVTAFTSKNVIREVTKRHASGVVGKTPQWRFVPRRDIPAGEQPTEQEAAAILRANGLMRTWFDARKVRSLMHDALCTLLFAARAPLRLYIPAGLLSTKVDDAGKRIDVVRATSLEEALSMIWPDHPTPEHAAVVQHDDTKMEAGVRLYEEALEGDADRSDNTTAPATSTEDKTQDCVELVFLNELGETVIRVLSAEEEGDDAAAAEDESFTFNFGGRLTMIEMRRDPLITPQVAQAQRALNLALSMLPRSVVTGGFLERVLLNAQMPGKYERDETGKPTGRFIPDPLVTGAGTTNFFAGIVTKNANGDQILSQPDIRWRDPVPVDSPIDAAGKHYLDILDETAQLHVVLSGDAVVSGKSREQARAEFLNSLGDTKPEAEAAFRFLLETPLAMAEALTGNAGELTSLVRVDVQCRLDTGPLETAERAANEASIGKTLSQETAMARNGVDDIDAEKARMAADPRSRASLLEAQGKALKEATAAGLSIGTAAAMLGLDAETTRRITQDLEEGTFIAPDDAAAQDDAETPAADGTPPSPARVPAGQARRTAPAAGKSAAPTGGAASQAGGSA